MKLDRPYQLKLLTMMSEVYPQSFDHRHFCRDMDEDAEKKFNANMTYLKEHGLVDFKLNTGMTGPVAIILPKITVQGLDFLADDGGLSAILGAVAVKLPSDTMKELIGKRIAASDLPAPDKQKWTDALASLPAESLQRLTMKLLDLGLADAPKVIQAIESCVP